MPPPPISFFNIWDRRTLSLRGRRRKKISFRKGLYPHLQASLNRATTALRGMVYIQTALSRHALYFFANRINFKLKAVDS